MRYQWDEKKSKSNDKKHGIRFVDACATLEDEQALTIEDAEAVGEARFLTIGRNDLNKLLLVVWCIRRGDCIRIISARKATAHEKKQFWLGI